MQYYALSSWNRDFSSDCDRTIRINNRCTPIQIFEQHLKRHPPTSNVFLLLLRYPKAFPSHMRCIISPVCSTRGLLPVGHAQKTSKGRHPGGIPIRCPNHLSWLFDAKKQQLYSELPPDLWAPHLVSKVEPSHPTEETHFGRLYLRSHSFSHYPGHLATCAENKKYSVQDTNFSFNCFHHFSYIQLSATPWIPLRRDSTVIPICMIVSPFYNASFFALPSPLNLDMVTSYKLFCFNHTAVLNLLSCS